MRIPLAVTPLLRCALGAGHEVRMIVKSFGNKPFDGLVDYFDAGVTSRSPELKRATIEPVGLTLHLYPVWFYGLYGVHQDKVDVLNHQLHELNEQIA